MNRFNLFLLTLSFSILFGVDASQEKFRDVENTQDNHQVKQAMNQNSMLARKAGIPKPDTFQKKLQSNPAVHDLKKYARPNDFPPQSAIKSLPPKNIKHSNNKNAFSAGKENDNQKRLGFSSRTKASTTVQSTISSSKHLEQKSMMKKGTE